MQNYLFNHPPCELPTLSNIIPFSAVPMLTCRTCFRDYLRGTLRERSKPSFARVDALYSPPNVEWRRGAQWLALALADTRTKRFTARRPLAQRSSGKLDNPSGTEVQLGNTRTKRFTMRPLAQSSLVGQGSTSGIKVLESTPRFENLPYSASSTVGRGEDSETKSIQDVKAGLSPSDRNDEVKIVQDRKARQTAMVGLAAIELYPVVLIVWQELQYIRDPLELADTVQKLLQAKNTEKALGMVRQASSKMACTVGWNHLINYDMQMGKIQSALKLYNEVCKSCRRANGL